jgi:AmmeMemoRadiSam system protein B/AmmeMemoRadiSam system protein A
MPSSRRMPVVAGRFYDDNPERLRKQLALLFKDAMPPISDDAVSALILPHAGFVFSGPVAASGVNQLIANTKYKTIFLIGSSHHMGFDGASVFRGASFLTPLGEVLVDIDTAEKLVASSPFFGHDPRSHVEEHSLEVQLPFLQYHLNKPFSIVPILIGTRNTSTCKAIAEVLKPYFTTDNLFVISTDFSHYPSDHDARIVDLETLEAIMSNQPDTLLKVLDKHEKENIPGLSTSLCGWTAVLTLLYITSQNKEVSFLPVMYQNSFDSPYGEKDRVVGYHSVIIASKKSTEFTLTENEKRWLLNLARQKIESVFDPSLDVKPEAIPSIFETNSGAFVSVYIKGKLNGCIGHIGNEKPLWTVVAQSATAAAFDDDRFEPLQKDDLDKATIEISVLTPPRRIHSPDEIVPGKHGILIKKGFHHGTFLPQVAQRMNWTAIEMLEKCATDKAGIGRDEWHNAKLYVYEAIVFKETK